MGLELFGLVCACGSALLVALLAAALLRLAVYVTNKLVDPVRAPAPSSGGIAQWDWDDWDDEYTTPARGRRGTGAVPEPGTGKGMVIMFITALAFGLAFVLLGFFAEEMIGLRRWRDESMLVVAFLCLPLADLILTVQLFALLPTTFWRAALVAFVYNLILGALTVSIGAVIFVIGTAIG
jgi:hypothetical protein